jgi:2-polyprenyl-3-methyl-5-hydroxy-6-metoxy-1,4-benzoquinol methylase
VKSKNIEVCPICGKSTVTTYRSGVTSVYSSKKYDVRHCNNCQHFFTWPRPSSTELDDIYTNRYSYDAHALIEKEKTMRANNYAAYISTLPKVSSALEVGCMHGLLLIELQKLGVKVAGVELDPDAVKICKDQGLDVTQSSIEDHLKKAGSQHDVIIMSHVIEHIVDPEKQLTELRKRMPEKGRLVLITPNSMANTRKLFGRYWGYWQVPVHINHFNEKSMRQLLKNSGFKINETKYYGADSLFFLSSLANLIGTNDDTKKLSGPKKALVKVATVVLRPWYHFGTEDMLVVASKA